MKSIMIIEKDGYRTVHYCSCHLKLGKPFNETIPEDFIIPTYYSEKHARDKGWRTSSHLYFYPPGEDYVWVCPKCIKGAQDDKIHKKDIRKTKAKACC